MIKYVIGDCLLDKLLVAYTPVGICSIAFGDTTTELEQYALCEFGELAEHAPLPNANFDKVVDLLDHPNKICDFQIHFGGTVFQRKVWQEIQKVPAGQTTTYKRIADALGMPKAARAVAKACASNRIALAIPCHRVVAGNGSLSGYAWGVERKRVLIERESRI